MNGLSLVFLLVVLVPLGVMVTAIPYLTRKTESFGVSIEEKYYHDPEIRGMRRAYALGTGTFAGMTLLAGVPAAAYLDENSLGWLLPVLAGALLIAHSALYLRFHFRMKALKERRGLLSPEVQQIVVDTGFHREKRAYSNWWLVPHLLVAATTAVMCLAFYDRFPERIVMQFDFQGNPTNVVDKSYAAVLMPVAAQLFLILVFWIVNYSIAASKQQIDAAHPHKSLQQNLVFRRKWSGFTLISGFLLVLSFTLIPLQMLLQFDVSLSIAVVLAVVEFILLGVLTLGFMTGQGGSRVRVRDAGAPTGTVNRDDDRYWKLGLFYFNPEDPALFLEKRFGIGWTVNYARPMAWVLILGPLVLIAVILLAVKP